MNKLLIDFNQLMLANVHIGIKNFGEQVDINMIRHLFFNNLIATKKKFKEYEEVIICCDGGESWRRGIFPYYKYKRSKARAESPLDWNLIFSFLEQLRNELKEFFPYRVIHVESAEGDDSIAVIVKYLQTNELVTDGLYTEPVKIKIISSDRDFVQLQRYPGVSQYSTIQGIAVKHNDPKEYLIEHIIRAGDDGIPNIYSADDVFATGTRQTVMSEKRFNAAYELVKSGEILNSELKDNYIRNKRLIDLIEEIPESVSSAIIESYKSQSGKDRSKVFDYFVVNKMKNLMSEIQYV